jgi:hypothetical protein
MTGLLLEVVDVIVTFASKFAALIVLEAEETLQEK